MQTKYGHLTYCTNIHPGESWADHFAALKLNFPFIKESISPGQPMGIGLRLSNEASLDILKGSLLSEFREWLFTNDAYVFTMNGFPYGGFHRTRVKEQVHTPDWTTRDRVEYTVRLFHILARLAPANSDAGISTSPLSYRYWFTSPEELDAAKKAATSNIVLVIEELVNIFKETGKILHLDIEPEPDGMLETGAEFIDWFNNDFLPAGKIRLSEKGGTTEEEAVSLLKQHLRLCYDVCHFAVGYEPHAEVIRTLHKQGIRIGKLQVSAALKCNFDSDPSRRQQCRASFALFNEPTYLHQVVARRTGGELVRYRDLGNALEAKDDQSVKEWRAHFHVPVFAREYENLSSTQDDILQVLELQKSDPFTTQLEVETYTWELLPDSLKMPIGDSIIRELDWLQKQLNKT